MAGSRFVRADLHVHTLLAPGESIPPNLPSPAAAVAAARQQGIAILGITDHNTISNVRVAVSLAGPDLLVLPGIEISTADGHLLGLFSPDNLAGIEDLARDDVLRLRAVAPNGPQRSTRSMADMVQEIHRWDGLAIAAHIDKPESLLARANPAALNDLLAQPGLAGIEITQSVECRPFYRPGHRRRPQAVLGRAREGPWPRRAPRPHHVVRRSFSRCSRCGPSDAHPHSTQGGRSELPRCSGRTGRPPRIALQTRSQSGGSILPHSECDVRGRLRARDNAGLLAQPQLPNRRPWVRKVHLPYCHHRCSCWRSG